MASVGRRWSVAEAESWRDRCRAVRGCNYVPQHCVNTTQMWQRGGALDDTAIVERELRWARDIGLNSLRVFVQYLVYETDPAGLLERMERFLDLADACGLSVMFVLLDDCWGPEPSLGEQPPPLPGMHNSRWTSSPGVTRRQQVFWPELARYVTGVIRHFAHDQRIIAWDLYNEAAPTSRPLVEAAFDWARAVRPSQPLVSCWQADDLSDLHTFHFYEESASSALDDTLHVGLESGRPSLCTECLARTLNNRLQDLLPAFAQAGVGWYVWGLVSGATQTRFPWGWPAGGPEPPVWFHDLLYPDGSPYDAQELSLIRQYAATP